MTPGTLDRAARLDRIRAAAEAVARRRLPDLGPFGTVTGAQEEQTRDDDRAAAAQAYIIEED